MAAGVIFSAWGESIALGQTEPSVLEPQTATGPGQMSCEIVFPCTENETEMVGAFIFMGGKGC